MGEKKLTLEETFVKLDDILKNLENPEISLEDSFQYYNDGVKLLKNCNEIIDQVEKKVLKLSDDGETNEF